MTRKHHPKSHPQGAARSRTPPPRPPGAKNRRRWLVAGGTVAILTGSALFNRARARRAETDAPPVGKFVEVDGVRLHYVDRGQGVARGQGPVVVLLHGNGVMLQDFEVSGVLGLAAAAYRVIAFDRPGFGYSDRPRTTIWTPMAQATLIARALTKIGVEHAVVVGHSWGTMAALAMALDHPGQVAGLVLVSGYYYATARPDVVSGSIPAIPVVGDVIVNTFSPLAGLLTGPGAVKASFAPAPVSPRFADLPAAMALRPSQLRATAADTATMVPGAVALSARYGELRVPVIVMAGDGDRIVHMDRHAERFVGEVDGVELRVVPQQGHMLHYAVPEQVVAAIDAVAGAAR